MVKIRIISTHEIREVTPNEAHGLIEKGIAELVKNVKSNAYNVRQMRPGMGNVETDPSTPSSSKGYKIK